MSYRIAGIDVHKKMLAVAVANVEVEGELHFDRCKLKTPHEGWGRPPDDVDGVEQDTPGRV
jgi:hypothetical protein